MKYNPLVITLLASQLLSSVSAVAECTRKDECFNDIKTQLYLLSSSPSPVIQNLLKGTNDDPQDMDSVIKRWHEASKGTSLTTISSISRIGDKITFLKQLYAGIPGVVKDSNVKLDDVRASVTFVDNEIVEPVHANATTASVPATTSTMSTEVITSTAGTPTPATVVAVLTTTSTTASTAQSTASTTTTDTTPATTSTTLVPAPTPTSTPATTSTTLVPTPTPMTTAATTTSRAPAATTTAVPTPTVIATPLHTSTSTLTALPAAPAPTATAAATTQSTSTTASTAQSTASTNIQQGAQTTATGTDNAVAETSKQTTALVVVTNLVQAVKATLSSWISPLGSIFTTTVFTSTAFNSSNVVDTQLTTPTTVSTFQSTTTTTSGTTSTPTVEFALESYNPNDEPWNFTAILAAVSKFKDQAISFVVDGWNMIPLNAKIILVASVAFKACAFIGHKYSIQIQKFLAYKPTPISKPKLLAGKL